MYIIPTCTVYRQYRVLLSLSTEEKPAQDDVIKWTHLLRYLPFVLGIPGHRWIPRTKAMDA